MRHGGASTCTVCPRSDTGGHCCTVLESHLSSLLSADCALRRTAWLCIRSRGHHRQVQPHHLQLPPLLGRAGQQQLAGGGAAGGLRSRGQVLSSRCWQVVVQQVFYGRMVPG